MKPTTEAGQAIVENADYHPSQCIRWTTLGRETCDCDLPQRIAAIESEAVRAYAADRERYRAEGKP